MAALVPASPPALNTAPHLPIPSSTSPPIDFKVSKAPYTLNRDKLSGKLVQNAKNNGPSVLTEVKDEGASVTLVCSPAYLQAIVLPAICSLSPGSGGLFTKEIGNCIISLPSIPTTTYDSTGLIVNSKLKFSISTNTQPPSFLTHVSVHLHNTTQKLQIQGRAKIADYGTAAGL